MSSSWQQSTNWKEEVKQRNIEASSLDDLQ